MGLRVVGYEPSTSNKGGRGRWMAHELHGRWQMMSDVEAHEYQKFPDKRF